ncbi:MAG TPA: hypothetical protein VF486_15190 [Actinomycetes bacterium]
MSISQVDMVVWRDGNQELQVCGDLGQAAGEPQSFLVVVRQGDNVASLHATRPFGDPKTFDPKDGRWELKGTPGTGVQFETGQSAVVSAVVVLKREAAGLETLSWVQPVEQVKPDRQAGDEQQLEFHPEVLAQPPDRALGFGHSVSSSLTILQVDATGGETFRGVQRIDKVPPAVPAQ